MTRRGCAVARDKGGRVGGGDEKNGKNNVFSFKFTDGRGDGREAGRDIRDGRDGRRRGGGAGNGKAENGGLRREAGEGRLESTLGRVSSTISRGRLVSTCLSKSGLRAEVPGWPR